MNQPLQSAIDAALHAKRPCPVCGEVVNAHMTCGALMLDWHLDARKFRQWCAGSDMNLTEIESEETE